MILIHHGNQFMYLLLSAKETHRKAQKHTECSYTVVVSLSHTSSVLGTAWLQHGFGSISFTLAGEKVPSRAGSVPARFIKVSWAIMARLGSARCRHAMVMFTLSLLIVPSLAGTVLARFQVAV